MTKSQIKKFQKEIASYYAAHKRAMAWRDISSAYKIFISEMMLQQTQVERVAVKYKEFIAKFPTLKSVAMADKNEILKVWQGLGYNRRALFIKKACEKVMSDYKGIFPRDFITLQTLPGIGPSTAGAICAFAYNQPVYFIETNVRAVLLYFFFKAQQDFLLPYVESGKLTLIGATTENPSFEVIPALLSRCRVFVLNELSEDEMGQIIKRSGIKINKEASDWLISMANGDARQMLAMIENTSKLYGEITIENLKNTLQSKYLRYDKKGDEHYNTISAFIKSMRASQSDAALYYLARMIESGEDPKFIARRMVIFASEDIGMKDPHALVLANAVFRAVETIGYPEAGINLAHGVVYLSEAPKTKAVYNAYNAAMAEVKQSGNLPIPMNIRNAPTKLMKGLGYGEGYEKYTDENLLPEKIKGKKFYNSGEQ